MTHNNLVPTPKPPMWFLACAEIARTAGKRVQKVLTDSRVESVEIIGIVFNMSWFAPLSLYENYFGRSTSLQAFTVMFPRPYLLACTCALGLYMIIGVIAGGKPSEFIKTDDNYVFWLRWRQWGLRLGGLLFTVIAILLTLHGVSVGTGVFGFGVLSSFWGVVRFKLLIKKASVARSYEDEDAYMQKVRAQGLTSQCASRT